MFKFLYGINSNTPWQFIAIQEPSLRPNGQKEVSTLRTLPEVKWTKILEVMIILRKN
jgi:hypothetical protein